MTTYAHPEALVETAWLAERLSDPGLRVIEVDEDTSAYQKGHIPGAIGWNWSTDLHAPVGRDYLSKDALAELLSRSAVSDATVILYGGNNNWFAAYAYWILKLRGFDAVRLLNGGRKKWELESRELVTEIPVYPGREYRIETPERPGIRAMRDDVLDVIGSNRAGLVDVRSPEEFRGEKLAPDHLPGEQAQVPGHIPGAVNVPWMRAANDDGTFKSADELHDLYTRLGITPDRQVIAYCRIGERSSHTWFALTELLGYPDVKNYDGSWTEYGSLVSVPVEMG